MTGTLITSEVDFDAGGKQQGYLRVANSVHRSAYGWLSVPITVIRTGDGPPLVISADVHGDEYVGQVAVATLAREPEAADMRDRLIPLPKGEPSGRRSGIPGATYRLWQSEPAPSRGSHGGGVRNDCAIPRRGDPAAGGLRRRSALRWRVAAAGFAELSKDTK